MTHFAAAWLLIHSGESWTRKLGAASSPGAIVYFLVYSTEYKKQYEKIAGMAITLQDSYSLRYSRTGFRHMR